MQLTLKHSAKAPLAPAATFIRGATPELWLHEIDRWGVSPSQLECYAVPESIKSVRPAGLFVIFAQAGVAQNIDLINPYGVVGKKLFVPVDTVLSPALTNKELQTLLLWERQVYHPTIGMVGFSKEDRIDLASLLEVGTPKNTRWDLADPGIDPTPRLNSIRVEQPTVEQLMQKLKDDMDTKDLKDIPKEEQEPEGPMDNFKRNFYKQLLNLTKSLNDPNGGSGGGGAGASGENAGTGGYDDRPSMLDRLENWLNQRIDDLEKKREEELQRLLNLFDKDTDEALRYAIPLGQGYEQRGTATPSSRLSRRPGLDFNLGSIGGGGAADAWNVDNYYQDLRTKYENAANKEIEKGDFRKAAYIYAHLLNDFNAAANVLKQGKHYREAAALYKDHLDNKLAAAECFEKGGLLLEAIELYVDMERDEKAGDLYTQLNQTEKAAACYERCIEKSLKNQNHLDAARLVNDKLQDSVRALVTLMDGWKNNQQHEACLRKYFDQMQSEHRKNVGKHVKHIYETHVPAARRNNFFNVLKHVQQNNKSEDVQEITRELAYEMLSEDVTNYRNVDHLHTLKQFVGEDRLIAGDSGRFAQQFRTKPKPQTKPPQSADNVWELDPTIEWLTATTHSRQLLAMGYKDNALHLARGNWRGHIEYYSWTEEVPSVPILRLITSESSLQTVFISPKLPHVMLSDLVLPKNNHFDHELTLHGVSELGRKHLAFGYNDMGGPSHLLWSDGFVTLQNHKPGGELSDAVTSTHEVSEPDMTLQYNVYSEMIFRWDGFYTAIKDVLYCIEKSGAISGLRMPQYSKRIRVNTDANHPVIAVVLQTGCMLFKINKGRMEPVSEDSLNLPYNEVVDALFTPDGYLVLCGEHELSVFRMIGAQPLKVHEFETKDRIVSLLSTTRRQQFGVLTHTGKLEIYDIDEENAG